MKQLTIRLDDPELERGIEELSKRRRWSVNQASVHLLRKGLGLGERGELPDRIGHDLDEFFGVWSKAEAEEFMRVIDEAPFSRVDPEPDPDEDLWK